MVFGPAFSVARQNDDIKRRLDDFRNQYGLNRNMAFVAFIAALLFSWKAKITGDIESVKWVLLAFVLSVGLVMRFVKFYAAFGAEVLRAYTYNNKK